jgi:hypothetical protein
MKRLVALLPVLIAFQAGAPPALAWTWPADGPVLKPFVLGDDPYAGGQHRGVDIAAGAGAMVRAPAAGRVSFAGTVPSGGRTVTVQTADGYSVTLVHLGSVSVAAETVVAEGAALGTIGPSGDPEHAEPYVHLGIRVTAEEDGYVDPVAFLSERPQAPVAPPEPPAEPVPAHPAPPPAAKAPGPPAPEPVPQRRTPSAGGAPAGEVAAVSPPRTLPRPARVPARARQAHVRAPETSAPPVAPPLPARTQERSFGPAAGAAVEARARPDGRGFPAPTGPPTQLLALAGAAVLLALVVGLLARRVRQLVEARVADAPLAVLDDVAARAAEDADALGSAEMNRLVLDGDLERVALGQAEPLANLDRDDDPAQLVQVPDDPCRRPRGVARRRFHGVGPRPPSRCRGAELMQAR